MGEFFALLTALCWATSSVVFSEGSSRFGAETVNRGRLSVAFFGVWLINGVATGVLWPSVPMEAWYWLIISGFVGFALSDGMLFVAFGHIGPKQTMLLQTFVPIFSALLGFIFMGESLHLRQIGAAAVTLGGIALVISGPPDLRRPSGNVPWGILMAVGAALGQALGLFYSKKALLMGVAPLTANQVRLLAGLAVMVGWGAARGRLGEDFRKIMTTKGRLLIPLGALIGPILGVYFSLLAVGRTHLALASTLMGLSPVLVLPIMRFAFAEPVTMRAALGTVVAVLGAAMIFWS